MVLKFKNGPQKFRPPDGCHFQFKYGRQNYYILIIYPVLLHLAPIFQCHYLCFRCLGTFWRCQNLCQKFKMAALLLDMHFSIIVFQDHPCQRKSKAPVINGPMRPERNKFEDDHKNEYKWLDKQMLLMEGGDLAVGDFVSWAAYHASVQVQHSKPPTTIALMPLFREVAHSFATIIHCMKTNQEATQLLNPVKNPY